MDAAAELGKNPVSKHQIQPEYGDEQANTGRDCQTRLARPNSPTTVGMEKRGAYKLVHGDMVTCQGSRVVQRLGGAGMSQFFSCFGRWHENSPSRGYY